MKIGSTFHILVFLIVVLVFSVFFLTYAQQNPELLKAVIAAEQDAKAEVNQLNWFFSGCALVGVATSYKVSQPSPERFVGKSPGYVAIYTQVYEEKVRNLQRSAATPGGLTTVFSAGILVIILSSLD